MSFTAEQILVVSVLSIWFLFPLGMLVSFIRQDREQHKANPSAPNRLPEYHNYILQNEAEEDEMDVPAYQIPIANAPKDRHPSA